MKYRPEIDGLRAVAVVPVILFHAGFEAFSGGFVGVDVFFVVSGYLITTIIIEDIENDRFSIARFYDRRARRILPALFFIMLLCIPFALMWMLPHQIKEFSQSLVGVTLFASNILFWREQTGYFAGGTEEIPLLHTWSLAVEEHYYLLFPVFLLFAWRLGRNPVFWIIVILAAISLLLSEWGSRNWPIANFYLSPTRAWELFAGSMAAFIVQKRGVQCNNTLPTIGLIAILTSIFYYDSATPFPSLYALLPVIGVVFIILFADARTIIAKLLSTRLLVGIGLISYSAYLWHQPLFAFARIRAELVTGDGPSELLMLALAIISLVLAWPSWRFVEAPFRRKGSISTRSVAFLSIFAAAFMVSVGLYGYKTNGFEKFVLEARFDSKFANVYRSLQYELSDAMVEGECKLVGRNPKEIDMRKFRKCSQKFGKAVVVLGDSHGKNLYNIIARSDQSKFVVGFVQSGCRPYENKRGCHYDKFAKFLQKQENSISKVIFHQSGSYFVFDESGKVDSSEAFEGSFDGYNKEDVKKVVDYLSDLRKQFDVEVVWLGPFIEYRYDPLYEALRSRVKKVNPESIIIFKELDDIISDNMDGIGSIEYVRFSDIFEQPIDAYVGDCFAYKDKDHFSECGEDLLAKSTKIEQILK